MRTMIYECITVAVLLFLTGGCRRDARGPEIPLGLPGAFSAEGSGFLDANWWRALGDDELNGLIEEALSGNFNLAVAWDRLSQAQAVARRTDSSLWPEADLTASASKSRLHNSAGVTETPLHSVGVAASYEVDLWSELASTRRAAWRDVEAQQEAVDAAAVTISASVAGAWYQLAEAKSLAEIAGRQTAVNEKVLDIVTVQFRNNMAAAADVLRQRQLVASTEAQLISAQETIEVLQYELSVLLGRSPQLSWQETAIEFAEIGPLPALGVPADVLWRRPDVRQGYRQLQAADERLAAAIADQYPRLSISASVSTSSGASARDLFDDWLTNLAANAVMPIFDGRQRKAEVQRNRAVVAERLDSWSQTVLEAIQEIETVLTQQRHQELLLDNIRRRLELAQQTYEQNHERLTKRQVDYIRVLESLTSLQELERAEATARRRLIELRIDLHRAIAGSCNPADRKPTWAEQGGDPAEEGQDNRTDEQEQQ
ncbi:MAG: efflux transporter outer membrane subunit [Sedimentisphaerales bacterium]|nr:efflux transporter outer membrane subunit [Sedimentisphaerales bacterium]